MKEVKPLEEYEKFSEIADMKREEFEQSLKLSKMNIGTLESLRKFMSLQYESMAVTVSALSELMVKPDTSEADKEQAKTTIQNMYLIMFSLEYKATLIHNKVTEMSRQLD